MRYKYFAFGKFYYLFCHLVKLRRVGHHFIGYARYVAIESAYVATRVNKRGEPFNYL